MNRLPFMLPDFCRTSWASDAARQQWTPAFKQIGGLLQRLGLLSVVNGQRQAGLLCTHVDHLSALEAQASKYDLELRSLPSFHLNGYVSDLNRSNAGGAFSLCAIGRSGIADAASEAYRSGANASLGRLLGYPPCCIAFFEEIWDRQRWIDTTWPMAEVVAAPGSAMVEMKARPENNMLLRWLGIRPVFHLPCSLKCEGTYRVANELKDIAKEIGEVAALDILYEVLDWPVQWSALHGIAEIETPILRICG